VSESRKAKRAERTVKRREERAQRRSQPPSKGAGRNVWLAAIGATVIGVISIGIFAFGSGTEAPVTTASGGSSSGTTPTADDAFPLVVYQGADAIGAQQLDFTELLGKGRPVVLNFWAGQCPPCRAEMPAFQSVYDAYGDDYLMVGVDIGPYIGLGSRQSAINLLAELGITYPAAGAEDARAVGDYNVLSMPTTIFYDGDGAEVGRQTGIMSEGMLEPRVRELIELSA